MRQNDIPLTPLESVIEIKDDHIYELNLDNLRVLVLPPEIAKLRLVNLSLAGNRLKDLPLELGNMTTFD